MVAGGLGGFLGQAGISAQSLAATSGTVTISNCYFGQGFGLRGLERFARNGNGSSEGCSLREELQAATDKWLED